ncbi:MAG: glycosyltransferase family 4 protein [Kiritimatiellae bacterium]|nr:glycosyltransferase family 4 protein [Kiritimatiellia bacterium]
MTVWIVNPFDNLPVEGYRKQRYWLMADAFTAAGHDVTYWTGDFSHANKKPRVTDDPSRWPDGIPAVSNGTMDLMLVPTVPYAKNVCWRRFASHVALARSWEAAARAAEKKPDLVIASTPPLSLPARALRFAKECGAAFVLDVMDAWPETFERLAPRWARPPFRLALAPLRTVARELQRGADGVTAVAERYLERARAAGSSAPTRLFFHGIELPPEGAAPRRKRAADGSVRAVYAGNMGRSYDLATAIDAVKAEPGVTLDLAGAGPDEPALRARAGDCARIRFHGYLDDAALRALLANCDVGLVPMFDDSCVGVPYKLADYAAAGLWIVNSLHGETEKLLAEHGVGTTYPAGDVAALRAALRAPRTVAGGALAALFDAKRIYADYVAFAEGLCYNKRTFIHSKEHS